MRIIPDFRPNGDERLSQMLALRAVGSRTSIWMCFSVETDASDFSKLLLPDRRKLRKVLRRLYV